MRIETVFFNETGILRSGWRCAFFVLAFIFLTALLNVGATLILGNLPIGFYDTSVLFYLTGSGVSLFVAVLLGWLCGRFFEHLPFRALGVSPINNWWKHLLIGLLIGAVSLAFAVVIPLLSGNVSITFNPAGSSAIWLTLIVSFVIFAVAAAFEESLFRGYLFQTLTREKMAWTAIVLTSVFFGAVHLQNKNADWISTLNTMLAGVWFAAAYLKTGDLWFPFGIHLMWNWTQGAIFGISVSGINELTTAPLLRTADAGPKWLTGGDYGIEGGIACAIAIIISTAVIYFLPLGNGRETGRQGEEETGRKNIDF